MMSLLLKLLDSLRLIGNLKRMSSPWKILLHTSLSPMINSKQLLKELPTCSPIAINVDASATNSISCEASILKQNVELRAQLKLLTSNYEILEESREKLSSSHEDLVSHDKLKLAHEAIATKVISSELKLLNIVFKNFKIKGYMQLGF